MAGLNKRLKYFFIAVLLLITAVLLLFSLSNLTAAISYKNYQENLMSIEDSGDFMLYDNYDTDSSSIMDFFSSDNALNIMEKTYKELKDSKEISYYEFAYQRIEYIGKENFSINMTADGDSEEVNQKSEDGQYYTPLKSFQIDESFLKREDLYSQTSSASMESFQALADTVPVLAGVNYKSLMQVGTNFKGSYLGKEVTFKVVGFLNKGASITVNKEKTELDDYLLTPVFCYSDSDDLSYKERLMSVKCEGFVEYNSPSEYAKVIKELNKIKKDTGFNYFLPDLQMKVRSFAPAKYNIWILLTIFSVLLFAALSASLIKLGEKEPWLSNVWRVDLFELLIAGMAYGILKIWFYVIHFSIYSSNIYWLLIALMFGLNFLFKQVGRKWYE